ncbi:hypothetical protein RB595_010299 [Gaeumannomyces hyphopodioides]
MKASIYLAASGLALALAGPVEKRAVVHTEVVTDIVYVTVTAGAEPAASSTTSSTLVAPTTTSQPPPPPPPKPTTTPIPTPEPIPTPIPTPEAAAVSPPPDVRLGSQQAQQAQQAQAAAPTDFASTAVYHHNIHRENNSAPALAWDNTYAGYAAETAKKCKFAHDMVPGGGGYGQNLAMWGSSGDAQSLGENTAIARAITNMWYNGEIVLYPEANYGQKNPTAGKFEQYGHYTQLVWADTKKVGCAAQYCPPGTMFSDMGAWFSVCDYFPAGNMGDHYGDNVLKPLGKASVNA